MSDLEGSAKPKRQCVVHVSTKPSSELIKIFDDSSWRKVKLADSCRRQQAGSSKYLSVNIPDNFDDSIGYHSTCYKNFTALSVPSEEGTSIPSTKNYALRSSIETSSSGVGIFPPKCLFCGHAKKSEGRYGKEILGNCETEEAAKTIYDAAVALNDHEMLAKISGIDLISKEAKYHHSCKRSYLHKLPKEGALPKSIQDTDHDNAFKLLCQHIRETLVEAEGAELLTSLHSRYMKNLRENSTYAADTLKEKILKKFPQLQQCKQSNKQGLIIYNAALTETTAVKRATFDHHSIVEAAFYLRGLVKDIQKNVMDLPDTLSADILSKGQAEPPDDLLKFFCVLYTGTGNKVIFETKNVHYPQLHCTLIYIY